jgi:hypothetical protein
LPSWDTTGSWGQSPSRRGGANRAVGDAAARDARGKGHASQPSSMGMPSVAGGKRPRHEALNSGCVDSKGNGYQQKLVCSSPSSPSSSTSFDWLKSRCCRILHLARHAASTFWLLFSSSAEPLRFPRPCRCPRPPHGPAVAWTRDMLGEENWSFLRICRRIRTCLAGVNVALPPHGNQ